MTRKGRRRHQRKTKKHLAGKTLAHFVTKQAKKLGLSIIARSSRSVYVRNMNGSSIRISDHPGFFGRGSQEIVFLGGAHPNDIVEKMKTLSDTYTL